MEAITDILSGSRWSRWRVIMWGAAACLLALPAIAMQFTGEVAWVQIDIDDAAADADHLISPEERFRIAMARQ